MSADAGFRDVATELAALRGEMLALEESLTDTLVEIPPGRRDSARNLVHYVALRRRDVRALQGRLTRLGLSSLGRCEAAVLANLEAVAATLRRAGAAGVDPLPEDRLPVDVEGGRDRLAARSRRLFGHDGDGAAVMVTAPSEAADAPAVAADLRVAGMDVLRINCAHDDPDRWGRMIDHLREAESGRAARVAMDLGGPKIRTGPVAPGPKVLSWRPRRDDHGRVVEPARVSFIIGDEPTAAGPGETVVPSAGRWWDGLAVGDVLALRDARDFARRLEVISAADDRLETTADRTAYVTPETEVALASSDGPTRTHRPFTEISPRPGRIVLRPGDRLRLTGPNIPGSPAETAPDGTETPASIGCTAPEIFADLRVGDGVLIDDGKLAGLVAVGGDEPLVEITLAPADGRRLRPDKGLNFPDTDFRLPALTAKDRADLAFVAREADVVNLSFVRRPEDIDALDTALAELGRPDMPVILKIENRQAFENLPRLLLATLRRHADCGVMIARGDLAAECGWERLVEVQEEILWLCEAAHVPVVWATQVLDGLAKQGLPTRAEVTDAGVAARAECVMLNKGPNVADAVRAVRDISARMRGHQSKKRPLFRPLRMADGLGEGPGGRN